MSGSTVDRKDDFVRSRWSLSLRRGVLERLYGNPELAGEFLAAGRSASPCLEAFLLFGHVLYRLYENTRVRSDPFADEFRAALPKPATAGNAGLLVRIFDFWRGRAGAPPLDLAESLVREYLRAAAGNPFSRAEACELIERIPPTSRFEAERQPFIRSVLKKDHKDPLFRLYDYCDQDWGFESVDSRRRKLENIMKEAVLRRDEAATQAIRRELRALDAVLPESFPDEQDDWEDEDIDDESDDDFDDDYDFDMEDMLVDMVSLLGPGQREEIMELADVLNNASEQEIRKIRKARPKGIPQELFDLFLEAVRSGGQRSGRGSGPGSQPQQRKHPNQGSLF